MSLLYPEILDFEPPERPEDAQRRAFRAGIKAAFLVSQLNRLGQVLCSRCGHTWNDLASAFNDLELEPLQPLGNGYTGGLEMGDDHPNNLVVSCWRCQSLDKDPRD